MEEMSAAGDVGMEINLDHVPTRQENMLPYEILLSESQERMLVVVHKGKEDIVKEIFTKWDLHAEEIGVVTDTKRIRYYKEELLVMFLQSHSSWRRCTSIWRTRASRLSRIKKFNIDSIEIPTPPKEVAHSLLAMPNIASKKWYTAIRFYGWNPNNDYQCSVRCGSG